VYIRAVHICMYIFKVLFSHDYTLIIGELKVFQTKFVEENGVLVSANWFQNL